MIYIAADHAGLEVKKEIIKFLKDRHLSFNDLGPAEFNASDDYPDYGFLLANRVAQDIKSKGILVCRSGIGMSIVANKVKGIRAALCLSVLQAQKARQHNDANVLVLAADFTPLEEMKKIINKFLETDFSSEERHKRRLAKIALFEKNKN
jgi:ribose 5-phosphate isomerase B